MLILKKITKKASSQVGIAIIVMAGLLFAGSIFFDTSSQNQNLFNSNNNSNNNQNFQNSSKQNSKNIPSSYLLYLNSMNIGKQMITSTSSPNILLGSKERFNKIYIGNSFRLNANPFTSSAKTFLVKTSDVKNINYLLLYFDMDKISGGQNLLVYANGKLVSKNLAESKDIPIKIQNSFNSSQVLITIAIEKPSWYEILNWNKYDISNIKVLEAVQDKENGVRNFNFVAEKLFLEGSSVDLIIACDNKAETSESIGVEVNGFILSDSNPNCNVREKTIKTTIPIEILNNGKNTLTLKTKGYYKVAFRINKVFYNDRDTYSFNINNFNGFNDVTMFGNFDKDVIDLRVNNRVFSLGRNQMRSIIEEMRFGVNQITFLTKPLAIKEFVIEIK